MAFKEVSDLTEVVTSEGVDLFLTEQGGITKKTTLTKVIASTKVAYEAADTTLTNSINSEITNRANSDATLAAADAVESAARIAADALLLPKTGGTLTGALTIIAPTTDMHASTKVYVDNGLAQRSTALEDFNPAGGIFPTTWNALAIKDGARYRISTAGTIISSDAVTYTLRVGDELEALSDTPAQLSTNWNIRSVLVEAATETKSGIMEIASTAETIALSLNTRIVTPLHLGETIKSLLTIYEIVSSTPFNMSTTNSGNFLVDTDVARTINLVDIATIAAGYSGRMFIRVVDRTGSANINNITINAAAGNTVNGVSSIKLIASYGCITLFPAGTNWYIIGDSRYKYDGNFVSAYMIAATQSIPDNATTAILFDTLENSGTNALGQFNIATGVFTPVFAGRYDITIQARLTNAALQDVVLSVTQGGVVKGQTQFMSGITGYGNYFTYRGIVSLTAATTVFNILQNTAAGGAYDLLGTTINDTFVRIQLIN